jgi:hypothetical protein
MTNRALTFLYQADGQLEAIAFGAHERRRGLVTEGYRDSGIPDLMIDLHPDTQQPYCFLPIFRYPQERVWRRAVGVS